MVVYQMFNNLSPFMLFISCLWMIMAIKIKYQLTRVWVLVWVVWVVDGVWGACDFDDSIKCQFIESFTGRCIYRTYSICLIITGNSNWARKQINLKFCLSMEKVIFDKNADFVVSMNTTNFFGGPTVGLNQLLNVGVDQWL